MSDVPKTNFLENQIEFKNKVFKEVFNEADFSADGDLTFRSCTFEKPIVFDNFNISGKLYFFDCKFSGYSVIKNSKIDLLVFLDCEFSNNKKSVFKLQSNKCSRLSLDTFKGNELKINGNYLSVYVANCALKNLILKDVNSEYSQFESKIEFKKSNTIDKLNIECSSLYSELIFEESTYQNIHFEGEFKNRVHFKGDLKTEYLFFESSTFYKRLDIENGRYDSVNFYRSNFQGLIWINGYDILSKTTSNLSFKDFSFHECIFEKNVSLNVSKIEYFNLSNNHFKQLLNFNPNQPFFGDKPEIRINITGINQGNLFFEATNTDINLSGINFGNINFKDIYIDHLKIDDFQNKGIVSFTNIKSGNLLTITNSIVGNTDFMGSDVTLFKEFVFADSNLNGINFSRHPFKILSYCSNPIMGYGIIDKSKWNTNLKNVYNQLKKNALLKGDIDTSMKYQSLEYKYLFKEKGFGSDKILLFLNSISNKNGLSWFRGVLFTLITAYLFMLLYLNILNVDFDLQDSLQNYVFFISSFPKLEIEKYSEIVSWQSSLVIWISRIFISYGIYQTIAAFRKYGKQ